LNAAVSGWLFDAYPLYDKMIFWIKQKNHTTIRLEDDSWTHSIYAASDNKTILNTILHSKHKCISDFVKYREFKSHYESITDITKSDVLKITLVDSTKAGRLQYRPRPRSFLRSSKKGMSSFIVVYRFPNSV